MRGGRVRAGLTLALTLAACGPAKQEAARAAEQRAVEAAPKFFCAQGQADLVAHCTLDREQTANGTVLTLRHPHGHFRRLLVTTDGRGVIAADGAQAAKVTITPTGADQIDVAIGIDRYRLPATITR